MFDGGQKVESLHKHKHYSLTSMQGYIEMAVCVTRACLRVQ